MDVSEIKSLLCGRKDLAVFYHSKHPSPDSNRAMDVAVNEWRLFVDNRAFVSETFYKYWEPDYYCRIVHRILVSEY